MQDLAKNNASQATRGNHMDEAIDTVPFEDGTTRSLQLQFTGSGSEYFRIWIVNLLLTIVTLSLYFPWAKVRKLRYFYGNTLVGGEPLGFHGDPKKMFKGYVLVAMLFGCYSLAGNFSPTAGLVALLLITALWPALMKSSLQFRLANTSWRGLRFHFTGNLPDAYRAMLPLFLPGALIFGLSAMHDGTQIDSATWQLKLSGLVSLASVGLGPWLFWRMKKYQHDNYALGLEQTRFGATVSGFYKLAAKVIGCYVLCAALIPIALFLESLVLGRNEAGDSDFSFGLKIIAGLLLLLLPAIVAVYTFMLARTQNLVWNNTASAGIQFKSRLTFKSLAWLTLKNWVLMACTLGLYWPFAAIALQRLRVEAVSIDMAMAPEQLLSEGLSHVDDAAGVAAGDFFGFDIGL